MKQVKPYPPVGQLADEERRSLSEAQLQQLRFHRWRVRRLKDGGS